MIVRFNVKCLTCDTAHTLRMQMGHNRTQTHEVICSNCQEVFRVALDIDFDKTTYKARCIDNCEHSALEGKVVNIDPSSPIPKSSLHQDHYFPWLEHARKDLKIDKLISGIKSNTKGRGGIIDLNHALGGQHLIVDDWQVIQRGWSLTLRGKEDLARKQFVMYSNLSEDDTPDFNHVIFKFSLNLAHPQYVELFNKAAEFYSSLKKDKPDEVNKFLSYYKKNIRSKNLESYLDIYNQFFQCFSDYFQTLLYVKNGATVPYESEVSSRAFRRTKMFYGNAFETLTSCFVTLACLNNVFSGRSYDQFETMHLTKYLTINKANRSNPFSNNTNLSAFSKCLDSTLRNASHHGAIKYAPESSIVSYRSGGTGSEHTMSYAEYITKCNEIMLTIAALLAFEILIDYSTT